MSKLAKCYKKECKMLSKTMLISAECLGNRCEVGYSGSRMDFNFSGFFAGKPDLHISVEVENNSYVNVWFYTKDGLAAAEMFLTEKQLAKLDERGSSVLRFEYDEAEDKLYKLLKYLYKNN